MNTEQIINTRTQTTVKYRTSRNPYERQIIEYAAQTYNFLIIPTVQTISLATFADLIAAYYAATEPRTAEIIKILRRLDACPHTRQTSTPAGTVCLDCRKIWYEM